MYLGDSYVNTYIKLYDDGSMGMNRKSKINGAVNTQIIEIFTCIIFCCHFYLL